MILTPTKQSRAVLDFASIAEDARAMTKILLTYVSPGKERGPHEHFALHHSQYSKNPFNFFVVNPMVMDAPEGSTIVVVNPRILSKKQGDWLYFNEACMSFPFRSSVKVKRYNTIEVEYEVPDEKGEFLKKKKEVATGLMAHIFQHEAEHARGTHIYTGAHAHSH